MSYDRKTLDVYECSGVCFEDNPSCRPARPLWISQMKAIIIIIALEAASAQITSYIDLNVR